MFLALIFESVNVNGHANMVLPHTWFDAGGLVGATAYDHCRSTDACMWFTNNTFVEKATMPFNSKMRTYPKSDPFFFNRRNPWGAPGSAKIYDPCGVKGGNPDGCPVGSPAPADCPYGGFAHGPHALDSYGSLLKGVQTTSWKAGDVVEAHWAITANHGGGYNYRLCRLDESADVTSLTEECFQAGALDFVGDKQWIQWGKDTGNRTEIPALRTADGTTPAGSTWTRNPVPACGAPDGGIFSEKSNKCKASGGYQFPPPAPRVQGYGTYYHSNPALQPTFGFNIVDKLQVPATLTPGRYVLSFRWDCEQTPQIWSSCSDIEIVAGSISI